MKPLVVSSRLLAALATWASHEPSRHHLGKVAFIKGEMIATDGHRLARIPCPGANGFGISVDACGIICRSFFEREDLTIRPAEPRLDGAERLRVTGRLPTHEIVVASSSVTDYPPVDSVMHKQRQGAAPDGIWLNARYLADVQRVAEILDPEHAQVKVVQWGGMLDALIIHGPAGSRFVIMPQRGDSAGG